MNARHKYILKLVDANPGIPLGRLQVLYDDGYPFSVDISTHVLQLLGPKLLVRGESHNGNNKGHYLPQSRAHEFRLQGRCAWCGVLSARFYCAKHREERNERDRMRRRKRRPAIPSFP